MDNSKKTVYQSKFFSINQVAVEHNGKKFTKDIIEKRDVVLILPLNHKDEISLVSQHRDAMDKTLLEVVAGQMDPGEDPMTAAKRELREETGLQADNWKHLATWYQSANMIGRYFVFAATSLHQGESAQDEDENITVVTLPFVQVLEKVLQGEIDVSSNVAALLLLDKLKREQKL